jgi:hypothetical protein
VKRLALLVLMWASLAAADTNQAKTFFEAGRIAYDAGDFPTAIRSLEQAYGLAPQPPIAFSLAHAYRKQFIVDRDPAKLKRAVELYRRYLAEVAKGGRRDDAIALLGELQPQLDRIEAEGKIIEAAKPPPPKTQLMVLSTTRHAQASIDGAAPGPVPLTREVKTGPHRIRVAAEGYAPQELDGDALEGQLVVLKVDLKELPALIHLSAPSSAEVTIDGRPENARSAIQTRAGKHFLVVTQRGHHPFTRELDLARGQEISLDASLKSTRQRRASYWVLGGGAALVIGGVVTSSLAYHAQSQAKDLLATRSTRALTTDELARYEGLRDDRFNYVRASEFLYGAGAAAIVTGALLYFLDSPRVERGELAPMVQPGLLGAGISRRF